MRRRPNRMEPALQLIVALMTFALFFSFVRADAAVVAWGDKGDQVTLIQQKLKQYGYFSGTVDGVFGKQTYDAVVWFQRKNGLKVDGAVGESTAAALGITLTGSVSAASYNESETYLLGRLVHGEPRMNRGGNCGRWPFAPAVRRLRARSGPLPREPLRRFPRFSRPACLSGRSVEFDDGHVENAVRRSDGTAVKQAQRRF